MEDVGREKTQNLRRFQLTVSGFEDEGNGPGDKECWQLLEVEKDPRSTGSKETRDINFTTQCTEVS